jgi:hypothetical protein
MAQRMGVNMITIQTPVYLLVPNESNERVLHPGRVLDTSAGDVIVIGFAQKIAPPAGSDVNLFFEHRGKFFQQTGTITAARTGADESDASVAQSIAFRCVGEPVSAESRGSYRVSLVDFAVTARVENDRKCPLVDISPEGLGLITKKNHRLGTAVRVTLAYEDEQLEGHARVQTVRPLKDGTFRCGLLVPSTEEEMRRSLRKMTAIAQRQQLKTLRQSA